MASTKVPGLFGQKHSSRDYTKAECWGKNQFNSSFPASLVAYMSSKDVKPVYICTSPENTIVHRYIDGKDLFGIDPLSEQAYLTMKQVLLHTKSSIKGRGKRLIWSC